MIVVIDDERTFATKLDPIYARSSNEGLAVIARHWAKWATKPAGSVNRIEELWLDHDLGGNDTITPVVDFLLAIDDEDFVGQIYVHSQNPSGAEGVYNALKKRYFCKPAPLPELL